MAYRDLHSSESGIETDQDTRHREKLRLLSLIPNKALFNSQEQIALVFNRDLPSKGGYHIEFKGSKREKMEVKAKLINKCTLFVKAPVYSPPERVKVHVRHISHQGTTSIGQLPFEFLSRQDEIARLLQDFTDPVTFMCEALGISSSDINALDKALTVSFKANIPEGFHLLGLRNYDIQNEIGDSLYPTLLHFAAAFGLYNFAKDCLCHCPGVVEATKLRNCNNELPSDIASNGQYDNLKTLFRSIEGNVQSDDIYEAMNENQVDDSYYTAMACQRYINLQLWQPSDVITSRDPQFYEDVTPSEDQTDNSGYTVTTRGGYHVDDEIYTDMESGGDSQYTDVEHPSQRFNADESGYITTSRQHNEGEEDFYMNLNEQRQEPDQELYEPMTDDTEPTIGPHKRYPTYDTPSNLPVSPMYPSERSLSMSLKRRPGPQSQTIKTSAPPVPVRMKPEEMKVPIVTRPKSTASRQSMISDISSASSSSASTVGSGFQADTESDDHEIFLTRGELMKQLDGPAPPPLPKTDYHHDKKLPAPPPSNHKPKASNRSHSRSQTAPVKPSDVETAASLYTTTPNRHSSNSVKERPILTPRHTSDIAPRVARRGSEGIVEQRGPAPIPPSAASSRQGVPTPFAQLIQQLNPTTSEELPPPPPARLSSTAKPVAPPRTRK